MHVVSVCFHYDKIIWLPWQRPLTNWKIRYSALFAHKVLSCCVKRLRKSVQYVQRYSTKYASFLDTSNLTFTNELCQLWSYWTEFHEIFTRYIGINGAVNAYIEVVISHSVSECQSDECAEFAIFSQNRLPWLRSLRYRKNRSRSFICTQNAFIWYKDCEN